MKIGANWAGKDIRIILYDLTEQDRAEMGETSKSTTSAFAFELDAEQMEWLIGIWNQGPVVSCETH